MAYEITMAAGLAIHAGRLGVLIDATTLVYHVYYSSGLDVRRDMSTSKMPSDPLHGTGYLGQSHPALVLALMISDVITILAT